MKNEIRKINKSKRAEMNKEDAASRSHAAAQMFLESKIYKNADCLMLYMPLGNETDTSDIIKAAFRDGKSVAFPTTDEKSGIITPYLAKEDTKFIKGGFSVVEPYGAAKADLSKIDVVVVPGIAFDRSGTRVGFGKGCYDRFLGDIAAVKVGFCYDFQICDEIPTDKYDVKMDYLVTESELIKCGK